MVAKVYEALYPQNSNFTTQDILALLKDNPALAALNAIYHRNEGYEKSLRGDRSFLRPSGDIK